MHRRARLVAVIAAAAGALPSAQVGAQSANTLSLPGGRVVEVIGLRRWTLPMLRDSLALYGDSLHTNACAATLRYQLGFADAAAMTFIPGPNQPERIVVAVREPQDSARVRYRALPLDTAAGRPDWQVVSSLVASQPSAFWAVVGLHTARPGSPVQRFRSASDSAAATAAIRFLRTKTSEQDRRAAQDALTKSPHVYDRATAALILANFPGRDDSYWALVEAMRESDGPAKGVAARVLQALTTRRARVVDWRPVASGVNAMLDGTSLFELHALIQALSRTGVSPAHARPFLKGGGEMLLAYLGSGTTLLSDSSHSLLVQLRGADLGRAPEPWRAWIASL